MRSGACWLGLALTACGPGIRLDADWTAHLDGAVVGLAIDPEGTGAALAVGEAGGSLVRFDADAVRGSAIELPGALSGPMARQDGSLVILGVDYAVGLDAGGAEVWRYTLPGAPTVPGAVAPDGSVSIAGERENGTGYVVRLAANGILFREFTPRRPMDTALVMGTDGIVFAGTSGFDSTAGEDVADLRAYDPGGDEAWTHRLPAPALDVAVDADAVYAALDTGTLVAVDRDTGGSLWEVDGVGRHPVVDGEGIVYTSGPSGLAAIDPTGVVLWAVDGSCAAQALGVDGARYAACGSSAGSVASAVAGKGRIHEASWGGAAPVLPPGDVAGPLLFDGSLYIGGGDGALYRFRGAPEASAVGWPGPRGTETGSGQEPGAP